MADVYQVSDNINVPSYSNSGLPGGNPFQDAAAAGAQTLSGLRNLNQLQLSNNNVQRSNINLQDLSHGQPARWSADDLNQAKSLAGQQVVPYQMQADIAHAQASTQLDGLGVQQKTQEVQGGGLKLNDAQQEAIGKGTTNLTGQFDQINSQYPEQTNPIQNHALKQQAQSTLFDQLTNMGVPLHSSWRTWSPDSEAAIRSAAAGYINTPQYNQAKGVVQAKGDQSVRVANTTGQWDLARAFARSDAERYGADQAKASREYAADKQVEGRMATTAKYEGQISTLLNQRANLQAAGKQWPAAKQSQLETLLRLMEEQRANDWFSRGPGSWRAMQLGSTPGGQTQLYNEAQQMVEDNVQRRLHGQKPVFGPSNGQGGNGAQSTPQQNGGGLPPGWSIKQVQ